MLFEILGYNAFVSICILLSETAFLCYATWGSGPWKLQGFIVMHMIIITLFGPKIFLIAGFAVNVTTMFFATLFLGLAMMVRRWGERAAMRTIPIILFTLLVTYVLASLLAAVPSAEQNQEIGRAIDAILHYEPPLVLANLIATTLSLVTMILMLRRLTKWWGLPLSIVTGHAVASLFFNPLAFSNLPLDKIFSIMLVGFTFKIIYTVGLIPAWLIASRNNMQLTNLARLRGNMPACADCPWTENVLVAETANPAKVPPKPPDSRQLLRKKGTS